MGLPEGKELLLLHNPNCSKSRAAKELLEQKGARFAIRTYLDDPLDRAELVELGARLGKPVAAWTRKSEAAFAEAGLDAGADEDALLDALASHPILMERPILVAARRATVGRPPEDVLELL